MHRPSATASAIRTDPKLPQAQATRILKAINAFFDRYDSGPDGIGLPEAKAMSTYKQLVLLERIFDRLGDFVRLDVKLICEIHDILRDIEKFLLTTGEDELLLFIRLQAI